MSVGIWLILGASLIIIEMMLGSVIFAFFGISALMVALLTWLGVTTSIASQLVVMALSSGALLFVARAKVKAVFAGITEKDSNKHDDTGLIGKIAVVQEIQADGRARVTLNSVSWNAHLDQPAHQGDRVRVVDTKGADLIATVLSAPT
jgi:membrane protein implicated in regulation of membrane protease activity